MPSEFDATVTKPCQSVFRGSLTFRAYRVGSLSSSRILPVHKRVSKRRWKARYLAGQLIPHEAILNHRLESFVSGCVSHHYLDAVRKSTRYEALGGWDAFAKTEMTQRTAAA